tara:strand:+ start:97 stop:444 length:348 start_codon:yes stop_codon:yes gene_type:complete
MLKPGKSKYTPDIFVDPEFSIKLDMDDAQDVATAAQAIRLKREGDYEGLEQLALCSTFFKTKKVNTGKEVLGQRTIYIMTNKSGVTSRIKDPAVLANMQKDGFTVIGTEEEDILG